MNNEISDPTDLDRRIHQGLRVIIVGGGLGGLTAAVSLRQQGHYVQVFEQSRFANEIGAAIHLTPNASGIMYQLGLEPRDSGAIPVIQTRLFSANNELLNLIKNKDDAHRWQNPWLMAHRAYLHNLLKDAAKSTKGRGMPVELHTSSKIVSVDPKTATVTLADGVSHSAEVLVGADGVHSNTRKALMANAPMPFSSGHNAFRFMVERRIVIDDPVTEPFAKVDASMDMWYGSDRKIVMYSTAHSKLLNLVCVHPASLSETSNEYNKAASKSNMLEVYKDFHPGLLKLLDKVKDQDLKVYPLLDLERLPTFINGRMALIGDAAHPFTPHLAQGAAMALEDGASLGVMLASGVTPDEVPKRLELYNKARYERASTIQQYSRLVGGDGTATSANEAPKFQVLKYIEYGLSHDEIHASTQILREYKWKQDGNRLFWRQPTVFGPLPGPRRDVNADTHPQSLQSSTATRAVVKFKTSATLLRNMFPNDRYSFEKPDTVAVASFSLESFKNLEWLGDSGYDRFALNIHGVSYKLGDGRTLKGTYCPVMFENLTDTILTGREQLGIPKLFSDIDISRNENSCKAKLSWRGKQWAQLELDDLQSDKSTLEGDASTRSQVEGNGVLVHKYIPASGNGQRGQADSDYDIFFQNQPETSSIRSKYLSSPGNVRLEIKTFDWKQLPTLHVPVNRLAEVPIFEILEGVVTEHQGIQDFSNAQKLD